MSNGLYFCLDNLFFTLFRGEREAYSHTFSNSTFQLNSSEFVSSLLSHQLCSNSPFQTLDKSVHYLPPATFLSIDKTTASYSYYPAILLLSNTLLSTAKNSNFDKCLFSSLQSILSEFRAFDLLFSGGIDSSVLYSHLACLN